MNLVLRHSLDVSGEGAAVAVGHASQLFWAMGENGLYKTSLPDRPWDLIATVSGQTPVALVGTGDGCAFVQGADNALYKSNPGGTAWTQTVTGVSGVLTASFSGLKGLLNTLGGTSVLKYSVDGGSTWASSSASSPPGNWQHPSYFDSTWVIPCLGGFLYSTDDGATFSNFAIPGAGAVNFTTVLKVTTTIYAMGSSGELYSSASLLSGWSNVGPLEDAFQVGPTGCVAVAEVHDGFLLLASGFLQFSVDIEGPYSLLSVTEGSGATYQDDVTGGSIALGDGYTLVGGSFSSSSEGTAAAQVYEYPPAGYVPATSYTSQSRDTRVPYVATANAGTKFWRQYDKTEET